MELDYGMIVGLTSAISLGVSLVFGFGMSILYPFTPKAVVQKYFRPPYFSEAFVTFYSGFPTVMYRGAIFARLAANPSSGRKRKLTEVYKELPQWYIWIATFLFWGFCVAFGVFLISAVLMMIEFRI
ncbi:MAG: hypothetical protein ACI4NJ_00550 [Cellvibrio sp.]